MATKVFTDGSNVDSHRRPALGTLNENGVKLGKSQFKKLLHRHTITIASMNKVSATTKVINVKNEWAALQQEAERVLVEAQARVRKIKRSLAWIKKQSESGAALPEYMQKALAAAELSTYT